MKRKVIFDLRIIKILPVLFISSVFILFPIVNSFAYGQYIWGRMGSSTYAELWDIWGTSANDIFAVGGDGAIIHYDGAAWHTMESTRENVSGSSLRGVWGSSSSNVYAVGYHGVILEYNGNAWSLVYGGNEPFFFFDVWGSSASDIFVVGEQGKIVHYDGNAWRSMDSGTFSWGLSAVWGSSASDVFVVGEYGKIFHYDGNAWSSMDSGTLKTLNGVWGTSATDVYAVGDSRTILHYNGSTWSPMTVKHGSYFNDVWGTSDSDIFVVGRFGGILHYNGSTWSPMAESVGDVLYGIWGTSPTNVYAVGSTAGFGPETGRTILYYGDWNPQFIWTIPNRETRGRESLTDFVQTVGDSKFHRAFRLWCDPLLAGGTRITITNSHPAFTINSNIENVSCNTYYHVNFDFEPTEPGLVRDKVTVSDGNHTTNLDIVGNGVPRETPEYWIADLANVIAWRLAYDVERDLLYITDSNRDLLIVFSIEHQRVIRQIPVGSFPMGLAIAPDGKRLYVANSGEYSISEINLETMGDVKTIPVPSLHPNPQINATPYDIAIVGEDTALVGGDAGYGSGGPIYELDLSTYQVSAREDIGGGNRPVLRSSLDFSTSAILFEPGASPSTVGRYDAASDSSISKTFEMERGVAVNKNGTRIAITWLMNSILEPDQHFGRWILYICMPQDNVHPLTVFGNDQSFWVPYLPKTFGHWIVKIASLYQCFGAHFFNYRAIISTGSIDVPPGRMKVDSQGYFHQFYGHDVI